MTAPNHYNAVSVFVDANVDRGYGGKPAFIDPSRTLTYQDLQNSTNKFANILGDLKIKRESRIPSPC